MDMFILTNLLSAYSFCAVAFLTEDINLKGHRGKFSFFFFFCYLQHKDLLSMLNSKLPKIISQSNIYKM